MSSNPIVALNPRGLRILDATIDVIVGLALLGEILIIIANVIGRYFFGAPILWANEVAGVALATIAFVGGAVAYRREVHIFVRTIVDLLPVSLRVVAYSSVDWLVLEVALLSAYYSVDLIGQRSEDLTPILGMHVYWQIVPLSVGMVGLAVYAVIRLFQQDRRLVLVSGSLIIGLTLALVIAHALVPVFPQNLNIALSLVMVLATVLLGVPVGFSLIIGTAVYLYGGGSGLMIALSQNMADGVTRFVLLALPFFIFAGFVMESGGISRRLIMFVAALVGRIRGGLMQVMVVSMYIVSGISGSKAADVAAVGLVMRNMMEKEGYEPAEAAAVLAASAAMGECVPPSIAMIVLGSITSLSMGALFAAGLLPAAVIAVWLMLLIYLRSAKFKTKRHASPSLKQVTRLGLQAIVPFSMPAFLFIGIFTGFATPTEISAFAVAYGLFIAMVVYREVGVKTFFNMVSEATTVSAMVLFTLAAAQAFSWVLSIAQLPNGLAELVKSLHGNVTIFMTASIVALVILGSLLEGLPALLILAPLLLPIAPQLGINPLHYGIVLLIAMGIGAFLPPLGVGFYIACAVGRAPIARASRIMMPYVAVLLIGLLFVAFIPWFTLSLPALFGFVR